MTPEEAQAAVKSVERALLAGDPRGALRQARDQIDEIGRQFDAREGDIQPAEAWAIGYMSWIEARCLMVIGTWDAAASALREARALLESLGDPLGVANCMHLAGELAARRGDREVARHLFEDARVRYEALPRRLAGAPTEDLRTSGAATCLHSLGELARLSGDTARATAAFEQALSHYEAVRSNQGIANCILGLGKVAQDRGEAAEARQRFEEARAHYEKLRDPRAVAGCVRHLGELAQRTGEPRQARRLFEEAQLLYSAIPDPQGIAGCVYLLGLLELNSGARATARRLITEARSRYDALPDPLGVAHCVRSLGQLAQDAGETTDARRLFADARARYEALPDPQGAAHCIHSLGELALHAKGTAEARRLFEDARARYQALPDPLGVANCLRSMGELARQTGAWVEAQRLFEEARARAEALPDPRGVANNIFGLAHLAREVGKTAEARRLFMEAEAGYRTIGDPMEAWCLMLQARLTSEPAERLLLAQRAVEVVERVRLGLDAAYARQEHALHWQRVYIEALRSARLAREHDEALRFATLLAGRLLYERQLSEGVDPRSVLAGEEAATFEGLTNAVAQAGRLLGSLTEGTAEYLELGSALERLLSEKRRLHEQAELRVNLEPPPPVDLAALKTELQRRDATLVFLLWQPELHTALVVHPDGVIEFVDYDGVPGSVDKKGHPVTAVQVVDAAFAALQAEAQQQVASANALWQSGVVGPLRRLLWEPLEQVAGDGPLYLVPEPALVQAPVRTWSRNIALLPTPGALLPEPPPATVPGSIFAVGGDVAGGLVGPGVDLALVRSRGGVTGVGDQLEALFEQDGSFELALVTGHMSRDGIALPRTVVSADTGEHIEISVTATLRELMALRLKLRWGVLAGCLSGASDGSPDLLSVGGVVMQVTGAEAVVVTLWSVHDLPATLVCAGLLHHTRQGLELEPALEATLEELRGLRSALQWADYLDVLACRHPDVPALLEFALKGMARHAERLAIPQVDLDAWAVFRR